MTYNDRNPDTRRLYAWLSRDQDGIEGVVAIPGPNGDPMPLIVTDEQQARSMSPAASLAAQLRGFPAHLVAFERTGAPIAEVG
jgi:hypothetical protein